MTKKKTGSGKRTASQSTVQKRIIITYSTLAFTVIAVIILVVLFYEGEQKDLAGTGYEKDIARRLGLDFEKEGELIFTDKNGDTLVSIDIEIADDDAERRIGMMFREDMEEEQGMFFIFPAEEIRSFWMRNTYLPLDMIFINRDNDIVTIRKNTVPLTENSYFSTGPAIYVIEVNAGFADRHGVRVGDRISWQRL
ncbi:MAG: DUF192 domain-containing protein [candidate division Zixibacteria bacterium]|nr:DUF192 domain-containing protein [candidate division Zixibacteria bacterium]